jgi:hypothetical protein
MHLVIGYLISILLLAIMQRIVVHNFRWAVNIGGMGVGQQAKK